MSLEKVIAEAMEVAARRIIPVLITEGMVTSVDRGKATCSVDREGLPELLNVRLGAITEPGKDVITIYPSVGSVVLCALVGNQPTDSVVLFANNIEELAGEIKGIKLSWSKNGIVINDGNNGGLAITPELKNQLDKNTRRVDKIIDILRAQVTSCSLHPNPAWSSLITPVLDALQKEDYSAIEDKKVTH